MGDAYLTDAELDELERMVKAMRYGWATVSEYEVKEEIQRLIAEVKELRARGRK